MIGKRVVGVSYDAELGAPVVVLKGAHEAADAILAAAKGEADVRVIANASLVDELYRTPIDGPVDRALFPVMAALLAHVVAADRSFEEGER